MSGNGPPPEYDSGALLAALLERPRPSKVIPFPSEQAKGTPFENIRIVVTPGNAQRESQHAAHLRMQAMKLPLEEWKTETGASMLGDFVAKEMLARMVHGVTEHSPNVYARVFANSSDVERALSGDEIAVLFDHAMRIQLELGPRLQVLTDAEVDAWIETLKGGFDFLARLQSVDLELLVRGLHRRLLTERAKSTGSNAQPSPLPSSLDSQGLELETSATGTTSSGEPQLDDGEKTAGLPDIDESLSPEDAYELARLMAGQTTTTE